MSFGNVLCRPNLLCKDGRGRGRPRQFHDLAPDVGGMLVHERLCWISEKQLGDDQQTNILFTVERLLQYVTAIAVGGQIHDTASE